MSQKLPSVTVVVPAFNASATLLRCLDALNQQTYPEGLRTVVVVDDGSTDTTRQIAAAAGVQVLAQSNKGAAAARNLGAQEAKSDIILFTDSDCIPYDDWMAEMIAPFSDPRVAGTKGFYRTNQSSLTARFVQAEYEIKCRGLRLKDSIDFIDTYSAGYRREIFNENGGFDTSYKGATAEDVEFSYRLAAKGCRLVAARGAYVLHRHPERVRDYFRKKCRYAYYRAVTWQKHPEKAVKDSYTPHTQKFEVLLSPLLALLAAGTILWPAAFSTWLFLGLCAFALNELSYFRQARDNFSLFMAVPLYTFLRGAAGALGVGARVIELVMSRPLGSFKFCS
jgi:cellulose synthase/poly-beta-1,6-N-acetylglucosamine synthase-like glycosyltransferase